MANVPWIAGEAFCPLASEIVQLFLAVKKDGRMVVTVTENNRCSSKDRGKKAPQC